MFERNILEQDYKEYDQEEENKLKNKSVVIPRSSILLKNKKNIRKLKANKKEKGRAMKNYSVSPSQIMFNSHFLNSKDMEHNNESKDQIKYTSLKNYNKKVFSCILF